MKHLSGESLSYVHGACDVPLIGETIGDLFDRVTQKVPDNEALVSCHQGLRYTYRQLQSACNLLARGLMACGLQKGERVGIWSPNYGVGHYAVRHRQDRRDPGQRQPRLPGA